MSWPLSHEFNEAIQNPQVAFADPDLRGGEVVVGATGLPLPRSGNFADVYQMRGADGRDWAVKCFTRPVFGLGERYAKVSEALKKANLPFAVGFKFLAEGIRVGGVWRPIVVMEWVEGMLLNQVVRDAAEKPATLGALGLMWVKLCKRLREAGIAHADIQHGNVLMVPGTRAGAYGLKLIDYDGVWVPALANTPSGESGHSSFQHPARAATRAYSPDVDRFPHLAVATALRGLAVAGGALWEKYDNGDNLLFTEDDFKKPSESKVMRELWQLEHPAVQALVGRLAIACEKPIPQTPWLDQLAPEGEPIPLDAPTRREAAAALGIALPVPVALPPEPVPLPPEPQPVFRPLPVPANPFVAIGEVEEETPPDEVDVELVEDAKPKARKAKPTAKPKRPAPAYSGPKSGRNGLLIAGGALGVLLLAGVAVGVLLSGGSKPKPDETAQQKEDPPADPKNGPEEPAGPPVVVPPKNETNNAVPPATKWAIAPRWSRPLPDGWKRAPSLRIGPDSRTGQVDGGDGKFVVFDTGSGQSLQNPPDAAGILYGVHVLNDGRVTKTWQVPGGPLQIWDARAGKEAAALPRSVTGPVHVEVSPNGRYMTATPGHGQGKVALKLTDTTSGKTLVDTDWARGSVRFTADSSRVLIVDGLGKCQWIKLPSGETDGEWSVGDGTGSVGVVAMSGDGSRVLLAGNRFSGRQLVDGHTGKLVRHIQTDISHSGLSHDGKVLIQSRYEGQNRVVEICDTDTGGVRVQVPLPPGEKPGECGLGPDGAAAFVVCSVGSDRYGLHRYEITRTGGVPPTSPAPDPGAAEVRARFKTQLDFLTQDVQFTADGRTILAHAWNRPGLGLVNAHTGAVQAVNTPGPLRPNNVVPLPGGRVGLRITETQVLTALSAETGKAVGTVPFPSFTQNTPNVPTAIQVSPDERYVAAGLSNPSRLDPNTKKVVHTPTAVRVLDTQTNKTVVNFDWHNFGRGGRIAFSADSSRVLVLESTLRGRWFKLPSGEPDTEWNYADAAKTPERVHIIGVSRDARLVLCNGPVGGRTRTFVLDATTGVRTTVFAEALGVVSGLGLSADGRRALLFHRKQTGMDRDFVVADTATGAEVARVPVPVEPQTNRRGALSPDGRALVVFDSSKSAPLVVYDIPAGPTASAPAVAVAPPAPPAAGGGATVEAAPPGEPPALATKWDSKVGEGKAFDQLLFAPDANAVLLGCASGFEALDPKSGIPRTVGFTVLNSVGVTDFFALQNGRVGTLSPKAAEIKVWDGKSGRLLEKHPLPDPGPGTGRATTLSTFLAPDEKHLVVARSGAAAADHPSVPFKVFDATGKREELALSWKGGSVLFATGSSRMLVAEWSGRCRWFDLSSGAAAESWDLGPDGAAHKITSASADGSVVGYTGPAATKGNGSAVLDGKTGKPIRVFHQEYHPNAPVEVSADGKRAALVYRADRDAVSIDVVDLATGARLGRAKLARASTGASASTQVPLFALAPDGRALAVYDPVSSRTHLFELPK